MAPGTPHLNGLIDLLVEAMVREIQSPAADLAPVPGQDCEPKRRERLKVKRIAAGDVTGSHTPAD